MKKMTLRELADQIGATLHGDASIEVVGCAPIDRAGSDEIAFVANRKYARHLDETAAAAVLVGPKTPCPDGMNRLVADDPYYAFRNAMIALHGHRPHPAPIGSLADRKDATISAQAAVHPDAEVGEGTTIHPFAVVEHDAKVGERCVIYPGVYIGPEAVIGDDCILYPNVTIYDRCILGNRVTLHSSTVIGQDGFGYATHQGAHHKIPQAGIVVIEDDVELGGGCAIERAAMGETRIGEGTKFADLISIGHGTRIGKHCLFVSFVGISGSVDVGNYVVLGGQVGVTGHLKIGDGVQAMARTAMTRDIPAGSKVGGAPSVPLDIAKRNALAGMDLYELSRRVRQLERQLEKTRTEQQAGEQAGGQTGG
ncbi:MAG: UDP-3-O-(3-hydroxymyristoyl)glucosamine N-acyltransferase [Phycisphaerales bacterium]|nr:MAG: UDP-3-O-(3-hydroxymyristoyl)glucosamine N-acyltransferase [Phycisphaerales bacterium]